MAGKKLTTQRKGELRWQKLVELEESGELQACKHRADVGRLIGIKDYNGAYRWVFSMIKKGAIIETVVGREGQTFEYEYHLGKKPSYSQGGSKAKKHVEHKPLEHEEFTVETPDTQGVKTEHETPASNVPTITVEVNGVAVRVDGVEAKWVAELVKSLK